MAVTAQPLNRDYMLMVGHVTRVTGVSGPTGDPDLVRYDLFLRNVLNPAMTLVVENHKLKRSAFKSVQVNVAQVGDAVIAVQCPAGLYVFAPEQLEFTENCA